MKELKSGVRILFTGEIWPGANSTYIANAFKSLGVTLFWINETAIWPTWFGNKGRFVRRILRPIIEEEWNQQVLEAVNKFKPNLVYITNGHYCWPKTLESIKKKAIPVMCFYHDVIWKDRPGSRFSQNIAIFDLIATTRRWHEPEFLASGAKAVSVARFGYEPLAHYPLKANLLNMEHFGSDVTFIGTCEKRRARELSELVHNNFPYKLRIWGYSWDNLPPDSPLLKYWQGRPVYEPEIPIIYAASKIALHWVAWEPNSNCPDLQRGDQHNSRTFQIPACGSAMMLAQRTDEHLQFFREDIEAIYFSNVKELREKLDFWLAPEQDEARKNIAAAARKRCLTEDYSYIPVVRNFLEHFRLPNNTSALNRKESI